MWGEPPAAAPEIPWLVALPLLAACAGVIARRASCAAGLAAAAGIAGLTGTLVRRIYLEGPQQLNPGGWAEPLGIVLRADGLGGCMLATSALVGGAVSVYASAYFRHGDSGPQPHAFWPLWMFLWASLNALVLSADAFNIYVALELQGLSAVALVALAQGTPAVAAAVRYLLVSLVGSLCYLMGAAFLYAGAGVLGFASLSAALSPAPFALAALALMSTGLCMKSALFPMHVWLPPAHANAPAPVSAALSGLVVKAAFYVMLRLWFGVFPGVAAPEAAWIPGVLGAAAVVVGSVQALAAPRLKQLVAYSTVAQVGYLFMVFPLGLWGADPWPALNGAMVLVASHACAKSAAFLAAGNVLRACGHDRIDELQGVVQQLPVTMFAFAVAGVSLIGLPPSGGFIAKWLLLTAALEGAHWGFAAVIVLGGLLATAYVFRVFSRSFRNVSETRTFRRVPRRMEWSALVLSLCSIALGVTGWAVLDFMQTGSTLTGVVAAEAAP